MLQRVDQGRWVWGGLLGGQLSSPWRLKERRDRLWDMERVTTGTSQAETLQPHDHAAAEARCEACPSTQRTTSLSPGQGLRVRHIQCCCFDDPGLKCLQQGVLIHHQT